MQRLKAFGLALSFALGAANVTAHAAANADLTTNNPTVQIQQIRNATAKINYAGKTFLVDPFLAK
ncbi:MAG: MBL fold metallo-hydrolase, partial [Achromobacter piechaudii]